MLSEFLIAVVAFWNKVNGKELVGEFQILKRPAQLD
jgi:hypothetical protein